jgi:hypothetical protein
MKWCIGFPFCNEEINEDEIACRKCWVKVPTKLRSEAKAVMRNWNGTKLYDQTMRQFKTRLHERLFRSDKIAKTKREFTIVG